MPGVLAKWKAKFPERTPDAFSSMKCPGKLPRFSRQFLAWKNWRADHSPACCRRRHPGHEHRKSRRRYFGNCRDARISISSPLARTSSRSRIQRSRVSGTEFIIFGLPFGRLQTLRTVRGGDQKLAGEWTFDRTSSDRSRGRKIHRPGERVDGRMAEARRRCASRSITKRRNLALVRPRPVRPDQCNP